MNFSAVILDWFSQHQRDLPWRHTQDAYAIWLSEIILQQTRIVQGEGYWRRMIERFPTVDALAQASEDEVLRMWQGLGYYSRARNLHFAAKQIVALGRFPDTFEEIRQLKGVGDYTAAAIASFAFHQPVAAVDGNVYRILARYFGIDIPINTGKGKKCFQQIADELLPHDAPDTFNQAMMDFGATQCTPASPDCTLCPLAEGCHALRHHCIDALPVKKKTIKIKERRLIYLYIRCNGFTAIRRRPHGDIWEGLWEPPLISQEDVKPLYQLKVKGMKHVLTHQRLLADLYLYEAQERPQLSPEYIWIEEEKLSAYATPRLIEKLIDHL